VWLNNDVVLRLQVDDCSEPIKEMRRLVTRAAGVRQIPRAPDMAPTGAIPGTASECTAPVAPPKSP
jgi:hypothetical protein